MKIFVINLDRRTDRLEYMSQQLQKVGLEFERISAVDGNLVNDPESSQHWAAPLFTPQTKGALGCYLSNKKIWQIMVRDNIEQALILQDDATFRDWNSALVEINLGDLKLDLLRMGANPRKSGEIVNSITRKPIMQTQNFLNNRMLITEPTSGACAYMITLEGARKCLKCTRYWINIDMYDMWQNFYGVRTAVLVPLAIVPGGLTSDISSNFLFGKSIQRSVRKYINRKMRYVLNKFS